MKHKQGLKHKILRNPNSEQEEKKKRKRKNCEETQIFMKLKLRRKHKLRQNKLFYQTQSVIKQKL